MNVTVDLSGVTERTAVAVQSLRVEQPLEMKRVLDEKAATDRQGHEYQNRTGNAEASTTAGEVQTTGDTTWCDLGMDVDYAIYLDARGLTRIRDLADEAEVELGYYFDGELTRIAGL